MQSARDLRESIDHNAHEKSRNDAYNPIPISKKEKLTQEDGGDMKLVQQYIMVRGKLQPALKYIAALLRKSQALRCLHLCGNPGLSREVIEWMRARIHARPARGVRLMEPLKATVKYKHNVGETKGTAKRGMPLRRGLMKVHRQGSIEFQTPR